MVVMVPMNGTVKMVQMVKFIIIFHYILFFMLLQLSQICPLFPCPLNPPTLLDNPHTTVHAQGSCIYILCLLYSHAVLYTPCYSGTTNLYFLIPSPFSPITLTLFPSGNHQNLLCIYDSLSVLLVCLFWFLDSIVNRYVFVVICYLV